MVSLLPAAMPSACFGEIVAALALADQRPDRTHFNRLWEIVEMHCDERQIAALRVRFPRPEGLTSTDMADRLFLAEILNRLGASHDEEAQALVEAARRDGATEPQWQRLLAVLMEDAP